MRIFCECCGKEIKAGEKIVKVEYGTLGFTAHPHARVEGKFCDYFHAECDVGVRAAHMWQSMPNKNTNALYGSKM